ncbi:MAG: gamma-glutamyl-gamma-aminobutyrate hydrolase family protein, partial [Myxococcaceae bacterium]
MTQTKKPLIGITTVQAFVKKPVIMLNQSYIDLIADLGGLPVLLTEDPEVVKYLDGLLIIGGQDIDPELYGEKQQVVYQDLSNAPNRRRDDFEIALYQAAKVKKIPVLGICRGLQLINVAEGGTLYQDLPKTCKVRHEAGPDGHSHGHFIKIDPQSKTYDLMQTENYPSSSLHHQGIKDLGKNLRAAAFAEDGLIEIIEWAGENQWVMAVQGHLEQTRQNYPRYDRLVTEFLIMANSSSLTK